MKHVRDIARSVLKKIDRDQDLPEQRLRRSWRSIVNSEWADEVEVDRVSRNTLYLTTPAPTWAQEISLRQVEIIERVNEFLAPEKISNLRIRIQEMKS